MKLTWPMSTGADASGGRVEAWLPALCVVWHTPVCIIASMCSCQIVLGGRMVALNNNNNNNSKLVLIKGHLLRSHQSWRPSTHQGGCWGPMSHGCWWAAESWSAGSPWHMPVGRLLSSPLNKSAPEQRLNFVCSADQPFRLLIISRP